MLVALAEQPLVCLHGVLNTRPVARMSRGTEQRPRQMGTTRRWCSLSRSSLLAARGACAEPLAKRTTSKLWCHCCWMQFLS